MLKKIIVLHVVVRCGRGESMTVIEMVKKLRVNTKVEIRVNNFTDICVDSDNIKMVKDELLNKEVDNWGVNTIGVPARELKIFLDAKENEHDGE